jgi:hypothetical protein
MDFLNRSSELQRLRSAYRRKEGALVIVYGRRRIGKTRLLLEWTVASGGIYSVADQSTADVQRSHFAAVVAERLPGFADVQYTSWQALLDRLAHDAMQAKWRGPIVFDEFPYLVTESPELPSVMQRWVDHDAKRARLAVAIAGSSQRMMQGLVRDASAPLFGRAREILALRPLDPFYAGKALDIQEGADIVSAYAAWGGVPRYWELAVGVRGNLMSRIDHLVLDPRGPLHREPDRLLLEELPPAVETRPLLDAIGSGAHRVSEIGVRIGRPATSMARPLERLLAMGLIRRDVPFGESEKSGRRSLYMIDDPFFRLWFRVVAPHRAQLVSGSRAVRLALLRRYWPGLLARTWEDLCRRWMPRAGGNSSIAQRGPWEPGCRWWHGEAAEWDVVSRSLDGKTLMLGEAKWSARPQRLSDIKRAAEEIRGKQKPTIALFAGNALVTYVLFVPALDRGARAFARRQKDLVVVTADEVLAVAE